MNELTCISCDKVMDDLHENQPSGGTCFYTTGHYGSAVSDHMDGTVTLVFVCDYCLDSALGARVAKEVKTTHGL